MLERSAVFSELFQDENHALMFFVYFCHVHSACSWHLWVIGLKTCMFFLPFAVDVVRVFLLSTVDDAYITTRCICKP